MVLLHIGYDTVLRSQATGGSCEAPMVLLVSAGGALLRLWGCFTVDGVVLVCWHGACVVWCGVGGGCCVAVWMLTEGVHVAHGRNGHCKPYVPSRPGSWL